ncbi:MAG: DUF2892 domain-containing protein [Chloroflexota bacterium]|nr:DUF2892 domain-containing protein [Chloroflexota bacterium]
MRTNEGLIDRAVRVVLGVALVVIGFGVVQGVAGIVVGVVGLVPLLTGLTGYCPLYALFGVNTLHAGRRSGRSQPHTP